MVGKDTGIEQFRSTLFNLSQSNFHFNNLKWALESRCLMKHMSGSRYVTLDDDWCRNQYEAHIPWFESFYSRYGPQAGNRLIGKQFETYIQLWLENSPFIDLHAHNIQITDDSRTIGEFDFLYSLKNQREVFHLETACKFYLSSSNRGKWETWIGPNGADRLSDKMEKLSRQLALSEHRKSIELLAEKGIGRVNPVMLMKGYFFHHISHFPSPKRPKGANPNYNPGWWIFESEIDSLLKPQTWWVIPEYEFWFASLVVDVNHVLDHVRAKDKILQLISENKRSVLLMNVEDKGDKWDEVSRGYVTFNGWPGGS
jgi:hypothetical protein